MRFTIPYRRIAMAVLALLCVAPVLTGCSKKVTATDADYTQVEGTPSANARLVVWPDASTRVFTLDDGGTPGTDGTLANDDFVIGTEDLYPVGPGAILTSLIDDSPATAFQLFRREGGGGFRQSRDFVVNPERKWRDSLTTNTWEMYSLADGSPSSFAPATYVARGLVGGSATSQSPLSNVASVSSNALAVIGYSDDRTPTDSLFRMTWTPVAGAAGYWIHMFQYRPDADVAERIRAGSPSPIFNGKVRDYLIAYVAAPANSYKPTRPYVQTPGVVVATQRATIVGQFYQVRISAVDASGQLIGFSRGDTALVAGETSYRKFAKGSFDIEVRRRTP